MSFGILSYEQRLHEAILDVYSQAELDEMVRFKLQERLEVIAPRGADLSEVVLALIDWAARAKRLVALAEAATQRKRELGGSVIKLEPLVHELQAVAQPVQTVPVALPPIPGSLRTLIRSYEEIPQRIAEGPARSAMMEDTAAKIRGMSLEPYDLPGQFHLSESAGERLAAVLALQQRPDNRYLRWLSERVTVESPFAGVAAAFALTHAAIILAPYHLDKVKTAAKDADDRLPPGYDGQRRRSQLQEALTFIVVRSGDMTRVPGLPFDDVFRALAGSFTVTGLKDLLIGLPDKPTLETFVAPDNRIEYIVFHLLWAADRAKWDGKLIAAAAKCERTNDGLTQALVRYVDTGGLLLRD